MLKIVVAVHKDLKGTLAVFHGPRCLAHDHADGQLIIDCRHAVREETQAHLRQFGGEEIGQIMSDIHRRC